MIEKIETGNINFSRLTFEEIYKWVEGKAFELYLSRGKRVGFEWQDWFDAEKILMQELIKNNICGDPI